MDISEHVESFGEGTPADVTLVVGAAGGVGSGKSRALAVVLDALKNSSAVLLMRQEVTLETAHTEVVVIHLLVPEPWRGDDLSEALRK